MTEDFKTLFDDLLAGRQSITELLFAQDLPLEHKAYVDRDRLLMVFSQHPEMLKRMEVEMNERLVAAGFDPTDEKYLKGLQRKDSTRRWSKLMDEQASVRESSPAFLTETTFDLKVEQYKALIGHVEALWATASATYLAGNYPLAAFLSILTIEEVGKLSHLWQELLLHDVPRPAVVADLSNKSHRKKHFIAVVAGGLVNSRMDRILGKEVVRKLIHEAESDELEKTRQASLYVDHIDGKTLLPSDVIDVERSRVLTVLAGELMAEVLGHYPWDFNRMIANVTTFELAIGIPEKKINPGFSDTPEARPTAS